MLTRRQRQLLNFIGGYIDEHGYSPSFDDMSAGFGGLSNSHLYHMVKALEERGFIRRLPNRARAIEILRMDASTGDHPRIGRVPLRFIPILPPHGSLPARAK